MDIDFVDIDNKREFFVRKEKWNIKKLKRIDRKIKNSTNKIIISEKVKDEVNKIPIEERKKILNIVNLIDFFETDKSLYKDFIDDILIEVILRKNMIPQEQEIYFLVNNNNSQVEKMIMNISEKYKMINIVTFKLNEFYKMENENIIVLNNKRKSLKRAKFVINIDFNEEDINRYSINRDAVILNLSPNYVKRVLGFDGVVVNNIKINEKSEYSVKDIYTVSRKKDEIEEKIKNHEVNFVGNNGIIVFQ